MKPCPFCAEKAPELQEITLTHANKSTEYLYKYLCRNCRAEGPVADVPKEAQDAWNERVS